MPLNTSYPDKIIRGPEHSTSTSKRRAGATSAEAWFSKFHLYPNLAGNKKIAEKSVNYVNDIVTSFSSDVSYKRRTWQVIQWILHVNTIADVGSADDVHVPELFVHREALVPRLGEAIFNYDPPFDVMAFRPGLEDQELTIRDFLWAQLLKNDIHKKFDDCFRSGFDFGVAIVKSWWEVKKRQVVEREIKEKKDGTFSIKKKLVEKIVSNKPRFTTIYPPYFIVDLKSDSYDDIRYIGDMQFMNLSQLQDLQAQGVFKNVDQLKGQRPQSNTELFWTYERPDEAKAYPEVRNNEDADQKFPVVELWGCLDLEGKGYKEYVITVANGTTVLRANENPFDDKHRPYAFATLSKHPFEIFGTGPAEPALPLQLEHDIHRNIAVQGSRLSVAPFIRADEEADVPDSLFGIEPGTVIRARKDAFEVLKFPNPAGDMEYMERILRRGIEEAIGTPRIYEGQGTAGVTATEVERKVQEGNRRIRGYVREFSRMFETLLQHFHSMNRQYITDKEVFRVLGATAKPGVYKTITPVTLDMDADFRMIGPENLHILGEESRNLQLFMNAAMPILQTDPSRLDADKYLERLERLLVGNRSRVIKQVPSIEDMRSPEEENFLLMQGERVEVHPFDEDQAHMEEHMDLLEREDLSRAVQLRVIQHITSHELAAARKQAQERAKQMQGQVAQPQVASPGQGTAGPQDAAVNMNRAAGATAAGRNLTNGPVRADQVATPGRDASVQRGPEQ